MIEFALVSTTLLLFFVGTLDLGRAVYYYDVLANAARDGSRTASLISGTDWTAAGNIPGTYTSTAPYIGTNTIVGASARRGFGIQPTELQVTISAPMGTVPGMALPVTVIIEYVYLPLSASFLGIHPLTIKAQSTMRIQ